MTLINFPTMQAAVNAKANASTTYTKDDVNIFLAGKTDDAELTTAVGTLTTSIGTVATAVGIVQAAVITKADSSTTYTKDDVNNFLAGKTDDAELTTAVNTLTTAIDTKQNKFLTTTTIPANTGRLFDVGDELSTLQRP